MRPRGTAGPPRGTEFNLTSGQHREKQRDRGRPQCCHQQEQIGAPASAVLDAAFSLTPCPRTSLWETGQLPTLATAWMLHSLRHSQRKEVLLSPRSREHLHQLPLRCCGARTGLLEAGLGTSHHHWARSLPGGHHRGGWGAAGGRWRPSWTAVLRQMKIETIVIHVRGSQVKSSLTFPAS